MDLKQFYLDPTGRIPRKAWWLGAIGLSIIAFFVQIFIGIIGGIFGLQKTLFGQGIMTLGVLAVLCAPYYALTMKRLHDRNRPQTLFWIFFAPAVISSLLMMTGLAGDLQEVTLFGQKVAAYKPNMLGTLATLASAGVAIWELVELGVLRGQKGANEHGPDPLAGGSKTN